VPAFNVKGLWELHPHFSVPGVSCILELYPLEHSHMVSGTSLRSVYGVVGNGRTRLFYPCYKKSTSYSLNGYVFLHCISKDSLCSNNAGHLCLGFTFHWVNLGIKWKKF